MMLRNRDGRVCRVVVPRTAFPGGVGAAGSHEPIINRINPRLWREPFGVRIGPLVVMPAGWCHEAGSATIARRL